MSGDQNPGRSPSCFALRASQDLHSRTREAGALRSLGGGGPSGCSSASRAPASGAGGRRSKACHPVHPASRCALRRICIHAHAKQDALRSLSGGGLPLAPLAQLAERSAYTRRELRTGARLEVRILQGVPSRMSEDRRQTTDGNLLDGNLLLVRPLSSVVRHPLQEGSAEWSATGPENQDDREVRGSIPQPSANPGISNQ
jgi:hypothetical protein